MSKTNQHPSSPQPQTFAGFAAMNRERCESPRGFNHPLSGWSTSDWFTAIMGELGEAANVAKKLNRVRDGIPGNKQTPQELRDKLRKELGDVFVYLDLLAQSLGFNIGDAAQEVFDAKSIEIGYTKASQRAPAQAPIPLDGKFGFKDGLVVNLVSGESIPPDEPIFLLRARDHHAYGTLMHYLTLCEEDCNGLHLEGIKQRVRKFIDYANEHPERMKQPGVTKHLKLEKFVTGPANAQGQQSQNSSTSEEYERELLNEAKGLIALLGLGRHNETPNTDAAVIADWLRSRDSRNKGGE